MNINIYEKYKIKQKVKSSLLSEENITIYDNIFVKEDNKKILEIEGGKLLEILSNRLKEDYISEFTIVNETFIFEYFNYNNGENWVISYTILSSNSITTC